MGLSSQQVLSFIPLDTWTHVFLIPGTKPDNDGTILVTTNEKYLKRCKDIYEMALNSHMFEKVSSYKSMELVALEIKGSWYRGRMLSYNEFLPKNTAVELIDSRSVVKKQLCDLYKLPDCYKYDPLCLPIKPINEISYSKLIQRKLCVQPLLLESELHKGYVVVNTKTINIRNELNLDVNWEGINTRRLLSIAVNAKDLCAIKETNLMMSGNFNNSIIQNLSKSNNLTTCLKDQDLEYVIEFSNDFIGICSIEKNIQLKTLLNTVDLHALKNIFTELISNMPNYLFLKNNDSHYLPVANNVIEYKKNEVNSIVANTDTSELPDCPNSYVNGLNTNDSHIFKNESSVEFCYGSNIDYVYIRSYEQKRKYFKEMKQFYVYCEKKDNLKAKTNIRIGDMVAALMTHYNEIHRAVILNNIFKNNLGHLYLCFFIDIGYKEYVKSNQIYYLPEAFQNVPYLAHKVGLKNAPFNNTMQLKYLKSYFDELYLQPLIIEFEEYDPDGLNNVVLKNKLNNMNIYLEAKEFLRKKISYYQLDNKEINSKISNYLNYNDLFKNGTEVLITNFDSVNQIFVRINTPELQEYYSQITKEIQQFYEYNKSTFNRKSPRIKERVAVYSSLKKIFARANVIKKLDETTYSVGFVDYGGRECIDTNNIFVLPYLFRHLPQSVIKIGLNITLPISKIEKSFDYINHLINLSVPLIAAFDEEDPLGFQNVCLKMVSNGVDIGEKICKLSN